MPITVLTESPTAARQSFGVLKGCKARVLKSTEDTEFVIGEAIEDFKRDGVAKPGQPIVIVHGSTSKQGATNTMRIEYA